MPAPTYRRLTEADYPRLTAYQAQQYSTADIAQELGCSLAQVQRALRHLGLSTGFKHTRSQPPTQPINWAQYQVGKWYERSPFSSRYLAERLGGSSWLSLEQQLRGTRPMSLRRLAALIALIQELDPEARLPAAS